MKLRIPDGCSAVCHGGAAFEIAADGSIEIDESDWPVFRAHGFTRWGAAPVRAPVAKSSLPHRRSTPFERMRPPAAAESVAALNRRGLFALLRTRGVVVRLPVTNEALRSLARQSLRLE